MVGSTALSRGARPQRQIQSGPRTSLTTIALPYVAAPLSAAHVPSRRLDNDESGAHNGTRKRARKTARVPIFAGKCHVKGLMHVEDKFRKVCNKLSFNTGTELFDNFEEVVAEGTTT